jgi:hypothetical protein
VVWRCNLLGLACHSTRTRYHRLTLFRLRLPSLNQRDVPGFLIELAVHRPDSYQRDFIGRRSQVAGSLSGSNIKHPASSISQYSSVRPCVQVQEDYIRAGRLINNTSHPLRGLVYRRPSPSLLTPLHLPPLRPLPCLRVRRWQATPMEKLKRLWIPI